MTQKQTPEGGLVYVPGGEILKVHEDLITAQGGLPGVLRDGYVDYVSSAVQQYCPPTLPESAAFLMSRIAKGHPFMDGNKRTAYFATRYFLMKNGADFNGENIDSVVHELSDLASAKSLDTAYDLALHLCSKDVIVDQPVVPNYKSFYRLVIKSIGVAKRLSET